MIEGLVCPPHRELGHGVPQLPAANKMSTLVRAKAPTITLNGWLGLSA
jgi:hypothetical protein